MDLATWAGGFILLVVIIKVLAAFLVCDVAFNGTRPLNTMQLIILAVCLVLLLGCASDTTPAPPPNKPHLLAFCASWCHWCPTDEQLAEMQKRYPGVDICHIDIDEHPDWAKEYGVTKVPHFVFCGDFGCWTTGSLAEVKEWLSKWEQ